MLVFASCEKDTNQFDSVAEEGYLQIEILLNPSIHPYAETVGLNVGEVRIGDSSKDELVNSETLLFDGLVAPMPVQLGSRALLTPGGYANSEFDLIAAGVKNSFVITTAGDKDILDAATSSIQTLTTLGSFLIENGVTTKRIMLLDMNKLVKTEKNGRVDFSFRENLGADGAFKLYDPKEVGSINGTLTRSTSTPRQTHRLVVYAYPMGGFDRVEEVGNGFNSASFSANVRRNDQFNFPILPEGAFELVVVEYQDQNQDNILEYKNLLVADMDVNQITRLTRVSKNSETQVQVKIGGIVAD